MSITFNKPLKLLILLSLVIVYSFTSLHILSSWPQAQKGGLRRHINQLNPPFVYLVGLSNQELDVDPYQLTRFLEFYKYLRATKYNETAMKELTAFCDYYLGQKQKALELYQQAIHDDPDFFWSQYDLALVFLEQKKVAESKTWFEKSLEASSGGTIKHIMTSQTYVQYVFLSKATPVDSLQQGYQKATIYLRCLMLYESMPEGGQKEKLLDTLARNIHPILF